VGSTPAARTIVVEAYQNQAAFFGRGGRLLHLLESDHVATQNDL
jgi:hypothetical protein